ncbi:MarR family transcriptional regulator [uncultured Tateyamaria sp.]|uniref:MarR family winged helix-turn-helix transcriptional regulator n=1 Tax=uncultured Tateyamaria sp. TaxID=455651 RepID=UPI002629DAC1|nr:MarR family transcriptional regulator [uncultured Tateyamaria sp.]
MTDSREASPLSIDEQLCFALYTTSRAFTKLYSNLLGALGLTYPQYLTMLILWERDGQSVKAIAEKLELEGATITPMIQRLERLDLVLKKRRTDDERRQDVLLTEKGRALRDEILGIPGQIGCAVNLNTEQARKLLNKINTLREAIRDHAS